jgi:hypothetical protein
VTLAYVFWHWPAQSGGYEEAIARFHEALGRPGTATFRLEAAPFDADDPPYEDWYPVEDWAAIGHLNDFAVTGERKPPHDAVAQRSRKGAGAVFKLVEGTLPIRDVTFAAWTSERPRSEGAAIWQRQLVLGPAPEYAVLAASPVEVPPGAVLTRPRLVAAGA